MQRDALTYNIIGCAMKVHNTLGNGFQEVIYQRCLAIELDKASINYVREVEQAIYYNDREIGNRRVDFVIEGKLIVELKALLNIEDVHIAQAKNYVVVYDYEKGLLINFGSQSLKFKLIFNPNYNSENSRIT